MADKNNLRFTWVDRGLKPKQPPNPDYPAGIDLDLRTNKDAPSCAATLPYPAKRIGYYLIRCVRCGLSTVVTTAGRADDPRSIRIQCKAH